MHKGQAVLIVHESLQRGDLISVSAVFRSRCGHEEVVGVGGWGGGVAAERVGMKEPEVPLTLHYFRQIDHFA